MTSAKSTVTVPTKVLRGNTSVKLWYLRRYPEDDLGKEINEKATFDSVWKTLRANRDIYHYLQVFDSIVRERVFIELAYRLKVPYDVVYLTWLNDPAGVKKTLVNFKNGIGEIGW